VLGRYRDDHEGQCLYASALWGQFFLLWRVSHDGEIVEVLKTRVEACAEMESLHSVITPFTRTPCEPAEWLKKAESMLMDLGWVRGAEQLRKVGLRPESRRLDAEDDRR
jgi:hypothetical protein